MAGTEAAAEAGLGVPRSPGVRLEAIWVTGAVLLLVALSCGLAPAPGVLGLSESGAVTDCFRGCFLVLRLAEAGAGAPFTEPVEVLAAGVEGLDVDFAGGEVLAVFTVGADLLLALLSSFFLITGFFTFSFFPADAEVFSFFALLRDSRLLVASLWTSCSSIPWIRLCFLASPGPRPP